MKYLLQILILSLIATSCSQDDEPKIPTYLDFEEVAEFNYENLQHATGFFGSNAEDAIYIAFRDTNPQTQANSEHVLKYELRSGKFIESYFDQTDFVTKRIHVLENELWVIGGEYINKYDLDLTSEPTSIRHGLSVSRFGSALHKKDLYLWGGDLKGLFSDHIMKWNETDQYFETIAGLPTPKSWAHGEISGDRLYIFGGQEQFSDTPPNDLIYIYDISQNEIATLNLPQPVFRTFTTLHDQFIYVAGHIENPDDDQDFDIFFGVYDIQSSQFSEIETSLSDEEYKTLHQITVVGNQLFALYGDAYLPEISIMVADLP